MPRSSTTRLGSSAPDRAARGRSHAPGGLLTIGALSRATGIPVETLRTWEARYGFPKPFRKPSGHRLYAAAVVSRLRRIAEALARGHRACETVQASDEQLTELLGSTPAAAVSVPAIAPADDPEVGQLIDAVARFDADALTGALLADRARLDLIDFLDRRIVPVVRLVGESWSDGRMQIRHEHFLSERIGDLLRSLRQPFEHRAQGPLVVFATLPGEAHGLGLQMAALVVAAAGCRVLYLGTDIPVDQVADGALDLNARAVALSLSAASAGDDARTRLTELRTRLPRRIDVLVGGAGATAGAPGLTHIDTFAGLQAWATRLVG